MPETFSSVKARAKTKKHGAEATADQWNIAQIILATVATVFALHWSQRFFIPLMLGIIVAYTLNPLVTWLERHRIHRMIGSSLVVIVLLCAVVVGAMSIREQVQGILDRVPEAAAKFSALLREMAEKPNTVQKVQAAAREIEQATNQAANGTSNRQKTPARVVVEDPKFKLVDFLWTGSMGMFGLMGEAVMLVLLVLFLLLSGDMLKRKLM